MAFEWSDSKAPVRAEVLRIAREQLTKAASGAVDTTRPADKRVHQARRRSKRLRGLFRLIRSDFPQYRQSWEAVRNAASHLSEARDTTVIRHTIHDLYDWLGAGMPELPEAAPLDLASAEQVLAGFAGAMERLEKKSRNWALDDVDAATIGKGLRDTYGRAGEARQLAADKPTDLHFHEWRKLAKYHWHHLTLFRPSADEILGAASQAAGRLGELLGRHHDLAVLRETLKDSPDSLGGALDVALVGDAALRRQAELASEALLLADQVFAETPEALAERLMSYLKAWRRDQRPAG